MMPAIRIPTPPTARGYYSPFSGSGGPFTLRLWEWAAVCAVVSLGLVAAGLAVLGAMMFFNVAGSPRG